MPALAEPCSVVRRSWALRLDVVRAGANVPMAMANVHADPPEGIARGLRVPNFAAPVPGERTLLFYEFATGKPMLLAACGSEWTDAARDRFVAAVDERARALAIQSVVFVSSLPADAATATTDDGSTIPTRAVVIDSEGTLRRRLFGRIVDGSEGALLITDPNLRVLEGAAVEPAALQTTALAAGIDSLVADALAYVAKEADAGPAVAPVLVIPRVLPVELCRGLIQSFATWNVRSSPMPTANGNGLAVDRKRKSRLDAFIEDPKLEKELTTFIANRVLPEIFKAFSYRATRFERFKLVCYRASDAGHFDAHRDNTAPTTAHRHFALTLNLNGGEYEGGALEFPEYGPSCAYDVAAGSAIIFSCTHAHRVGPVTKGERFALISFTFGEEALAAAQKSHAARASASSGASA